MNVVQKKVWVTQLVCKSCGVTGEIWHHGEKTRPVPLDYHYPASGQWDGWSLKRELCSVCWTKASLDELRKERKLKRLPWEKSQTKAK